MEKRYWGFLGGNLEAMKDQALRNLVDDICFSSSNKIHKTYVECIMDKTEEKWKSNYPLLLEEYQESWSVECCINRLSRSGHVLEAVGQQEKEALLSALWLLNHRQSIEWILGYNRCIMYFVIWQFLIYDVSGYKYPLALVLLFQ